MLDTRTLAQLDRVICAKAEKLVKRYGFNEADREDIEQELWLGVLSYLKAFRDASMKPNGLVCGVSGTPVLDHAVVKIVVSLLSYRSWHRRIESQDLSACCGVVRTNGCHDSLERRQLRVDIQQVIDTLPVDLKALCGRLYLDLSTAVLQTDEVPHVFTQAQRDRLRCIFRGAYLHEYLL